MWERYYSDLKELPKWLMQPASFVVEALPTLRNRRVSRVLDLGCGAGRHCLLLAKSTFEVVGVDRSFTALKISNDLCSREQRSVKLTCATMTCLPFRGCVFDAVISVSVIHHALKKKIAAAVREIHRVLNKNGLFLANLVSVKDPRYGTGRKVEEGTFIILEAFTGAEELHHFFSEEEVSKLLAPFTEAEAELSDDRPHYWRITATK